MGEAARPLLFEGFQAGCHVVLRGRRGTLWRSNLFDNVPKMSNLEDVSHEMLVFLHPRVSSRVAGFPVASPSLWGKPQNHTLHSTLLHTLHSTLHTLHFPLSTFHSTLHTLHSTLHTLHVTLYTLHSSLCTPHSTLSTFHSTLHTLHFTLYTPHSSLYTPHSTLSTPHSTLYTPHFTLECFFYGPHLAHPLNCRGGVVARLSA